MLRSFYKSQSLQAIYLQNADVSYKLDFFKRKLALLKGAKPRPYDVEVEEFELKDCLTDEQISSEESLDNRGLLDYVSTISSKKNEPLPKSSLYLDPYNECTCNHELKERCGSPPSLDDDDNNKPSGDLDHKIAKLDHIVHNSTKRGLNNRRNSRQINAGGDDSENRNNGEESPGTRNGFEAKVIE